MFSPDIKIDLHIHTTASDGTWNTAEVLEKIKEKNIRIFSITDHDSIESCLALQNNFLPEELFFIPGCEISCSYKGKEYHITAYSFDLKNKSIIELIEHNRLQREEYNQSIVKFARNFSGEISLNEYLSYDYDKSRGGWKALNYLIDKGIITDIRDFFDLAVKSRETLVFEEPSKVIKIIQNAGGYAFLAHPSAYDNGKLLPEKALDKWKYFGISGIECFSPYLKKLKDADYYINYCRKNNLLISAGSDCHGDFTARELGNPHVTIKNLSLKPLLRHVI